MTTPDETRKIDGLQLIFSLFLGALLVVVVGVGVWTFYPQPYGQNSPEQQELDRLYEEQGRLDGKESGEGKDITEDPEWRRIQNEIQEVNNRMQAGRDAWAVNTSIILLVFATVLMAISLFLPEHMKVFSNGILLGGLFTVVYGTGWSFAGGDSRARFFVVLAALALSVLFGYLRFILRNRRAQALEGAVVTAPAGGVTPGVPTGAGTADVGSLASLEARVAALEAREAALAAVFGGGKEPISSAGTE